MLILSWNVASVRARLDLLKEVLKSHNPDIVLLQEIKATEETFPFLDFKELGYYAVINGQKSYNGVAILSKKPFQEVKIDFNDMPVSDTTQARFIQAKIEGVIYMSVYVPNGNPPLKDPTSQKNLIYKLEWMKAFHSYLQTLKTTPFVLGGDFNVIEKDSDVYNPAYFKQTALMRPEVQALFKELHQDFLNPIRLFHDEEHYYSFWDFQGFCWQKNNGILLDYFFLSDTKTFDIKSAGVLKEIRGKDKTSDHAPVFLNLL